MGAGKADQVEGRARIQVLSCANEHAGRGTAGDVFGSFEGAGPTGTDLTYSGMRVSAAELGQRETGLSVTSSTPCAGTGGWRNSYLFVLPRLNFLKASFICKYPSHILGAKVAVLIGEETQETCLTK